MKRNVINVFLVGGNRTFEALNPLRPQAKGKDRQGIVRSYRADRLQTVEPSDVTGYEKPDYSKQVRNLSSELDKQFWEGDSQQFSPAVRGGQEDFTPPTKTIKAYKLFRTLKTQPGKLFPLFIGKGEPVPVGQWIPAKFIPTKGFAERPGWHAGVLPNAPHLLSKDGTMPSDRVWAEVEIPADVDWQSTADATSTGDIKSEVPSGGYYTFKRPGLQGGSWVIGGALKVNRLLSQADVDKIMSDAGASKAAPVSGQVRNSPQVVPPEQLELNFNKAVNREALARPASTSPTEGRADHVLDHCQPHQAPTEARSRKPDRDVGRDRPGPPRRRRAVPEPGLRGDAVGVREGRQSGGRREHDGPSAGRGPHADERFRHRPTLEDGGRVRCGQPILDPQPSFRHLYPLRAGRPGNEVDSVVGWIPKLPARDAALLGPRRYQPHRPPHHYELRQRGSSAGARAGHRQVAQQADLGR